jgi:hypothetical protein
MAGFAVLGVLVLLLILAGMVYADNYRLDRYMRSLVDDPATAALSPVDLNTRILDRARQLGLPLHAYDITITRAGGTSHIRIAKYAVQTSLVRMDLRMPAAASR